MSKKVNEGVTDFIIKKMIGLIAGGKYRQAMKAAKGNKKLQKNIQDMNDSLIQFKATVAQMKKDQAKKTK